MDREGEGREMEREVYDGKATLTHLLLRQTVIQPQVVGDLLFL